MDFNTILDILNESDSYDKAEKIKTKAEKAKSDGDEKSYNKFMAEYHDLMVQWHESKGRTVLADKHFKKMEEFDNK